LHKFRYNWQADQLINLPLSIVHEDKINYHGCSQVQLHVKLHQYSLTPEKENITASNANLCQSLPKTDS